MKERYKVLILFFCLITISFGQIVNESFENEWPPIGWGETGMVLKEPGDLRYHPSSYGVKYIQFNTTGDSIATKPIKNPGILTFWNRTSTDYLNPDELHWRLVVQTSEDGIYFSTPIEVLVEQGEGGSITNEWSEITVDLNLTGTYIIRWFMEERIDDWALVDYVNVSQQSGTSNVADYPVISEIYSRGGLSGSDDKGISTYNSDYVTLYNPTSSSINLEGWSVQVLDNPTELYEITTLTGSISPYSYYLLRFHINTNYGLVLPNNPIIINNDINLSPTRGQIALVNDQNEISGKDDINVIDFVAYTGSDSYNDDIFEWEGFKSARYSYSDGTGNTYSIRRKDNNGNETSGTNGSGYDINDNRSDFYVATDLVSQPPLPVELTSFSVTAIDNGAMLNWTTATEVNNYGFEIERASAPLSTSSSVESNEWENIGFIEGHGNSYSPKIYSFIDSSNLSGDVNYRLKQIDTNGDFEYSNVVTISVSLVSVNSQDGMQTNLYQNHPNPFNPSTKISFSILESSQVNLTVYNMLGQKVIELVNRKMDTGKHSVSFDASELSSGLYIYRLITPSYSKTMKMMLLR